MRVGPVKRVVMVLVAIAALYAAAGFLLAPWLAQRYLPGYLGDRLGRDVQVREIRVNPFLLTVQASGVTVQGHHGRPVLAADRLFADASAWGLLRGNWAMDEISAQGLTAHVVLAPDGTLNLEQLARQWRSPAKPDGSIPAIQVERLSIADASVTWTDLTAAQPASVALEAIQVQVDGLSTLAGESATYQLSAMLPGGGNLHAKGAAMLQPSLSVSGQLDVQRLQAEALWPVLRGHVRLADLQGTVGLSARFEYDVQESMRISNMRLDASDVLLASSVDADCTLQVRQASVRDAGIDLGARQAGVGELAFAQGAACIAVAPDGQVNWAGSASAGPQQPDAQAQQGDGWSFDVRKLRLDGIDLDYTSRERGRPLTVVADGISAELGLALSTAPAMQLLASDVQASWRRATLEMPAAPVPELHFGATRLEQGRFDLASRSVTAARLHVEAGRLSIVAAQAGASGPAQDAPRAASTPWSVLVDQVQVVGLHGAYARAPGEPVVEVQAIDGDLGLELQLGGAATQVKLGDVDAKVKGLVLASAGSGAPPIEVSTGSIVDGSFDLAGKRVAAGKVTVNGSATLVRAPGGALALPGLAGVGAGAGEPRDGAQEWRYALGAVQVPSLALALVDRTFEPALRIRATLQGQAKNVASAGQATFEAVATLAGGGTLKATGTAAPRASQVRADVTARGIPLQPLQPVLAQFAALQVRSGSLSGSAHLAYDSGSGGLRADGRLGIANLHLDEAWSGDRFLSWKQLDVQDASFDLRERKLAVQEVIVTEPAAKIAISEDGKVNVAQVFRKDDAAPAAVAGPRAGDGKFAFEVGRVRLRNGEVDFADLSLLLPFSTTVKGLDGAVVNLSSVPSRRAVVSAKGQVEPYGSARVEGSIVPTEPTRFTDLQVEFNNVLVPPLSPYTATFAGRKVSSGKLWLDLDYKVQDGEMLGSNDIRLEDFRLGERVEAPKALDIPLDLVVALLSDASGEIRLSVPVRGEVGDAEFSVAAAVRQAIGNVIERVATAPFRALANLFGGGADALASIGFRPGSAELRQEELEKLDTLTRALRERPQLQLVVEAPYDPELDARALRSDEVRRSIATALGRGVGPGEDPGPVAFDDPAARRELERMLRAAAGPEALERLRRQFSGESDGRELYRAVFESIAAATPLSGNSAQMLAVDRARTIASYLERQGIQRSRVRTGALATVQPDKEGEVSSRLQVAAAADGRS